jgi:hypothetical protein
LLEPRGIRHPSPGRGGGTTRSVVGGVSLTFQLRRCTQSALVPCLAPTHHAIAPAELRRGPPSPRFAWEGLEVGAVAEVPLAQHSTLPRRDRARAMVSFLFRPLAQEARRTEGPTGTEEVPRAERFRTGPSTLGRAHGRRRPVIVPAGEVGPPDDPECVDPRSAGAAPRSALRRLMNAPLGEQGWRALSARV